MRWSVPICILLLSLATANANEPDRRSAEPIATPSGDVRPKRSLATLIKMKKAIIGKVFGTSAAAESYKLYRIPGHDNILVKAIPIKAADSSEVQAEVPSNPTITLLESYLGTRTPNETWTALDGVNNLLGSGILSNDTLLNRLLVPVQPPQVTYRVPQLSQLYPSVFRAPLTVQAQPFVPGKPCVNPIEIAPRPLPVQKPIEVIPEATTLPPLSFLPQVLVPTRPVIVKESPMPVKDCLNVPPVVIPDYRPVQVSKIPSNPWYEHLLYKLPAFRKPLYYPGAYSYQQFHNNGTVTLYTDSKVAKPLRPAVLPPLNPGYSYHQIKNDGSVTTFGSNVEIPLSDPILIPCNPAAWGQVNVEKILNKPRGFSHHQFHGDGSVTLFGDGSIPLARPAVLPSIVVDRLNSISKIVTDSKTEVFVGQIRDDGIATPNNPAAWGPVHVEMIPKNPSGFSSHQFHGDGSVTLYGDGSIPLARPAVLPSVVADRVTTISEKVTDSKPEVFVGTPEGTSVYSYHQINNGGSVTTYSGDGKKTNSKQATLESPIQTPLRELDVFITEINTPEFGPVKVQKIPRIPSGFSYDQVNADGSGITYTGADVMPFMREPSQYSTLFFNRPALEISHPSYGPVHVGKLPGQSGNSYSQPGYTYHIIDDEETVTTNAENNNKRPSFLQPPKLSTLLSRPDFSSQQPNFGQAVHIDKITKNPSSTIISGNDGKVPEAPRLSTMITHPEVGATELPQTPHYESTEHSGFAYHQSNGDGSATIFTGSDVVHKDFPTSVEHMEPQTESTQKNNGPEVLLTDEGSQQYLSILDSPNKDIRPIEVGQLPQNPSSGFSYTQINNDGSVSTYGSNEVKVTPIVSTPTIPAPPSVPNKERLPKPCVKPIKCVVETKVTFPTPVVSTYEYKQVDHSHPDEKFTVVNVNGGSVSVTAPPVSYHISRRPVYRRRTRPTSTELPLATNPIVVPEEANYSYKQTASDGMATTVEGNNQNVTVSVSEEARRTVQRGDIPE